MPWSAWRVRHAKWGKTCNQRYLVGENRKGSGRWGRIKLGNWPLAPTYSLQPICFSNITQHFLYYSPYLSCLYSFPASHIGRIKSFIPTQDIQTLGTIPWKDQVVFSKKKNWGREGLWKNLWHINQSGYTKIEKGWVPAWQFAKKIPNVWKWRVDVAMSPSQHTSDWRTHLRGNKLRFSYWYDQCIYQAVF